MELLAVDVNDFLQMSILSMAEQQQLHRTVVVTLYLLKNVYDTPFFVFLFY
jgi:hypothetical protein